jgi:ubiquinone/menaquinone biosynthesis C-methylase UbiE
MNLVMLSFASLGVLGCLLLLRYAFYIRQKNIALQGVQNKEVPVPSILMAGIQNSHDAESVGKFYDRYNDAFIKVYGDVIQAFRTTNVSTLLDYQATTMKLQPEMRLLDAGCGICGPAIHFAKNYGVHIDAVTISSVQAAKARTKISDSGLIEQISVHHGDYHFLSGLLDEESFDVVYFLESFGHSHNKQKAIESAWNMLKPGGLLYIKDLFVKESMLPSHNKVIAENVARINKAYYYDVGYLNEVIGFIRKKGFILSALKTIDIPLQDFENLTISNDFQELTGIHQIDNLQAYLFPVDFFELQCIKPWYDVTKGNSRYFLQNLYYLQVHNRSADDL